MQNRVLYILLGLVVAILLIRASVFTVSEGTLAIKSVGGEIVDSNISPGLHFRIPVVQDVALFDKRIITKLYPAERFLTSEQEQLNVDFYVKWRIDNLRRYYEATGGNEDAANDRLGETIKDAIKSVVTQRRLHGRHDEKCRTRSRADGRRTRGCAHHENRFAAAGPGLGFRAHAGDLQGAGGQVARRGR
jgi:HflC protein